MGITFRILTSSSDMSQTTQSLDPSTDLSPTAGLPASLPDHTQLPDSDGNFVFAKRAAGKNFLRTPRRRPPHGLYYTHFAATASGWAVLYWSRLWDLLAHDRTTRTTGKRSS